MVSMTATEARRRLYALLETVADSHEPIQIAGKRHSAVLVSESDWRAKQEARLTLRVGHGLDMDRLTDS